MLLGELQILPTANTPEFLFNSQGVFEIKGRGLYAGKEEVSQKVWDWIDSYLENPVEITYVIIKFEYLNSLSTLILVDILRKLSNVILQSKKITILWYYEEDDFDIFERGEYVSQTFGIPIKFIVIENKPNL